MWNKLYRRDLLAGHGIRFRQELFAEDQLFNTEYLRYVRTAVSIPDIGYYYLQCSQSVSHSRVTTADILRLRRRVMGLENAVNKVLDKGLRTADNMSEGCTCLGCTAMGDAILAEI